MVVVASEGSSPEIRGQSSSEGVSGGGSCCSKNGHEAKGGNSSLEPGGGARVDVNGNAALANVSSAVTWNQDGHPRHDTAKQEDSFARRWLKLKPRGFDDDSHTDWWFASTAIPLLAATIGPLANVLSLAALVTYWRMDLLDAQGNLLPELAGLPFQDPRWCYWLNLGSLICGFAGNIFLLFNFTSYVRYIIALPMTIFLWFLATAILVGITVGMHVYAPPLLPHQTYSQGYWDAVIAAVLYFICSGLLMINMLGYFFGHYPQRFELTDHQRTLIIQTMLFFIWLAGGAAMFSKIEARANPTDPQAWAFVDGLYFCDVTILTVGFGDLYPVDNLGRGLVFPYTVGGIVMLGLVISSLHKFAAELSQDKIVKKHIQKERSRTAERTVTESSELTREEAVIPWHLRQDLKKLVISGPLHTHRDHRRASIYAPAGVRKIPIPVPGRAGGMVPLVRRRTNLQELMAQRKPKLILLKEERDRFNAMRGIQKATIRFKHWWALTMSITAFAFLWVLGAIVFWRVENSQQDMTYFQALYFCYVSLLTIGYGDLTPKSNAGRAFFVVWSLIAVPTMTILISDMGNTVINGFKEGTFKFADFTVLPQKGVWKDYLDSHPKVLKWFNEQNAKRQQKQRLKRGMTYPTVAEADAIVDDDLETPGDANGPSIEALAREAEKDAEQEDAIDEGRLARRLSVAIRNVAADLRAEHERKYTYEEWVELTRLIRFTSSGANKALREEETEGMVEWDWIGEDSPMMSGQSEPEFVLQRLCESLSRYVRRAERQRKHLEALAEGKPDSEEEADEEEEQFGPLRRNPTWDALDAGDGDGDGIDTIEEEPSLPDNNNNNNEDTSETKNELTHVNTHNADDFNNDGNIAARHDHEQIGPMDERDDQVTTRYYAQ